MTRRDFFRKGVAVVTVLLGSRFGIATAQSKRVGVIKEFDWKRVVAEMNEMDSTGARFGVLSIPMDTTTRDWTWLTFYQNGTGRLQYTRSR